MKLENVDTTAFGESERNALRKSLVQHLNLSIEDTVRLTATRKYFPLNPTSHTHTILIVHVAATVASSTSVMVVFEISTTTSAVVIERINALRQNPGPFMSTLRSYSTSFDDTDDATISEPSRLATPSSSKGNLALIIGCAFGGGLLIALIVVAIVVRRKRAGTSKDDSPNATTGMSATLYVNPVGPHSAWLAEEEEV
jgi:hypothetical protein